MYSRKIFCKYIKVEFSSRFILLDGFEFSLVNFFLDSFTKKKEIDITVNLIIRFVFSNLIIIEFLNLLVLVTWYKKEKKYSKIIHLTQLEYYAKY